MHEQLIGFIALCIAVPVAVRHYKKVMGGNSKKDRFMEKARRNGCVTTAVCVDTEYLVGDSDGKTLAARSPSIEAKYEYRVDGVTYYKRVQFQNSGSRWIDWPDTIEIYYDKNNPKKVVTPVKFGPNARRQSAFLGAVGIWFVLNAIVVVTLRLLFQR